MAAPGGPGASSAEAVAGDRGSTPLLHGLAVFMALWTFALLFVGGLVTSQEAGLSVPDWPLSYGTINPPGWTTTPNVNVEHGHRLLGWGIGMMAILLAVWIQLRERRRWMRILGWATLGFVIAQGVIGGYFRVVLLQHNMAIVHGILGQGFFCLVVAMALFTSRAWRTAPAPVENEDAARMHRKALFAVVAVYVQVVIGALIRHSRVGHSVPHVAPHAVFALLVAHFALGAMVLALGRCGTATGLRVPAVVLGGGVILQLMLGLGAYFANTKGVEEIVRPPYQSWTATAHQAAGAVVLAAAVVLHLRSRLLLAAPRAEGGAPEAAAGAAHPAGGARMNGLPPEGAVVDLAKARAGFGDYLVLAKMRLNTMVLATTFGGAWFGSGGSPSASLLVHAVCGTGLVAVGASALNMVMERRTDALMLRTRERPLPSGRMQPGEAVLFGVLCSAAGIGWLAAGTNLLAAGLAAATLAVYLGVYTPMKGHSAHNTLVGAVPGALPPMIGWAAGAGSLDPGAWVLFTILYLWQIPHFLSIAWLYREDYERAGLVMMPMVDRTGATAGRHAVLYAAVLTAGSLFAVSTGLAGGIYLGGAVFLGVGYTVAALGFARLRNDATARRLLRASLLYLPLLFLLLGIDPAR